MNEPVQWRWLLPLIPMTLAVICAAIFVCTLCFLAARAIFALWPEEPVNAVFYGSLFGAFMFFALGWAAMTWRDMR